MPHMPCHMPASRHASRRHRIHIGHCANRTSRIPHLFIQLHMLSVSSHTSSAYAAPEVVVGNTSPPTTRLLCAGGIYGCVVSFCEMSIASFTVSSFFMKPALALASVPVQPHDAYSCSISSTAALTSAADGTPPATVL